MRVVIDQFVREVVDLVRNESDKLQPLDEAFHFILPPDLHFQHAAEKSVEPVRASSGSHDLDALAHLLDGDPVESGGMVYQRLDELDAFIDLFCLEADKIEGTTGEVLDGRSAKQRGM